MEIVKFKREQEQYLAHIKRVRNVTPMLDTSTPKSLGLKHLQSRPKKQQLIDDRNAVIAKDNAQLMHSMTKIMSSDRKPSDYSKPPSLNEVERKRNVDALNFENKLMLHRLKTVPPVLSNKEIKHDFEKHLAASSNLRRKQMKPMSVPKDLHTGSSLRKSTFDSSTYSALLGAGSKSPGFGGSAGFDMDIDMSSPITTMQDFRRQVISSKKSSHHKVQSPPKREAEPVERNETLYELSHG